MHECLAIQNLILDKLTVQTRSYSKYEDKRTANILCLARHYQMTQLFVGEEEMASSRCRTSCSANCNSSALRLAAVDVVDVVLAVVAVVAGAGLAPYWERS